MPTKIVVQFNRTDEAGWSEVYFNQSPDLDAATAFFQPVLLARRALLASYAYVYAIRYSQVTTPPSRVSRLIVSDSPAILPSGQVALGNLNPDVGSVGALGSFINATGGHERRLIRGVPDGLVEWSGSKQRMALSPFLTQGLDTFTQALTATSAGMGWIPRGSAGAVGTKTNPITATVQLTDTQLSLTYTGTDRFVPLTDGTLILGGFRGAAAALNGSYGYHQWSNPTLGTVLISRAFPSNAALAYQGTGATVRVALGTLQRYLQTTAWQGGLVRTRNIGGPFGRTRGRRRRVA